MLIHLGIKDPLGQCLPELIQQPVLGKHLLRVLARQQFLDELVPDRHTFLQLSAVIV